MENKRVENSIRFVKIILLALVAAFIFHYSAKLIQSNNSNIVSSTPKKERVIKETYRSVAKYTYADERYIPHSCIPDIEVKMTWSKDTLYFEGEGHVLSFKPIAFEDSATVIVEDIAQRRTRFRRLVNSENKNIRYLLFMDQGRVGIFSTHPECAPL